MHLVNYSFNLMLYDAIIIAINFYILFFLTFFTQIVFFPIPIQAPETLNAFFFMVFIVRLSRKVSKCYISRIKL